MIYVQQAVPGSNEPAIIYGEGLVALSGAVMLTTLIQTADHADIESKLSRHPLSANAGSPAPSPLPGTHRTEPESVNP